MKEFQKKMGTKLFVNPLSPPKSEGKKKEHRSYSTKVLRVGHQWDRIQLVTCHHPP